MEGLTAAQLLMLELEIRLQQAGHLIILASLNPRGIQERAQTYSAYQNRGFHHSDKCRTKFSQAISLDHIFYKFCVCHYTLFGVEIIEGDTYKEDHTQPIVVEECAKTRARLSMPNEELLIQGQQGGHAQPQVIGLAQTRLLAQ